MEKTDYVKCQNCGSEEAYEARDTRMEGLIGICLNCGNDWSWGELLYGDEVWQPTSLEGCYEEE